MFLQGLTTQGSDASVRRSGFDLQPCGPALAVFPWDASSESRTTRNHSPRGLSLSLRAALTPCLPRRHRSEVLPPVPAPLLRFLAPSSACVVEASTSRGLASAATFRLRRFDDLDGFLRFDPTPSLLGERSWGCLALQGSSRAARATPLPASPPLMVLPPWLLPPQGLAPRHFGDLQGLAPRHDRIRPLPVSLRRGTDPLMGFYLFGPCSAPPSRGRTLDSAG